MPDILHRIGARGATPEAAYDAVATADGVASWWSTHVDGGGGEGSELHFSWDDPEAGIRARITALRPAEHVEWEITEGPDEWLGTRIGFDLRQDGEHTIVLFGHRGWARPVEFMHHCSTKWAVFLISLKSYLETGEGRRSARDLTIDNW